MTNDQAIFGIPKETTAQKRKLIFVILNFLLSEDQTSRVGECFVRSICRSFSWFSNLVVFLFGMQQSLFLNNLVIMASSSRDEGESEG